MKGKNIFDSIDSKLVHFAERLGAKATDGSEFYLNGFPLSIHRRIYWVEEGISKIILIQPSSKTLSKAPGPETWDFLNIAWIERESSPKRFWRQYLVFEGGFSVINNNIDELLIRSLQHLSNVSIEEFKKQWSGKTPKPGLQF